MDIRKIQILDMITLDTAGSPHSPEVLVLQVLDAPLIESAGDGQSVAEFTATSGQRAFTVRAVSPHQGSLTRWSVPTWRLAVAGSAVFSNVELLGWLSHRTLDAVAVAIEYGR
jgi:hypothetical protein